jgi:ferrochelatase
MTPVPFEKVKAAAEVKAERIGVLLVNLGTPDTADTKGVRVYLKEFLSDIRVIEDQGLLWKLALNGVILRVRPGRKARDYQKIWNTEKNESPLKTITRAQAEKLAAGIDALWQSLDCFAHRSADGAGLRPAAGGAALSAIFGRNLGNRV